MRVLVVEQPQRGILLVDLVAADMPGSHVVAIRALPDYDALFGVDFHQQHDDEGASSR